MSYRIPLHRPTLPGTANRYLAQALAGQQSADGPFGRACEAWLAQQTGRTALLTSACTTALELAAQLGGIGANDEFILPAFTFPSTANAFVRQGAKPVFVDIRKDTLNLDEELVESAITPRTRALVCVHYAGVGCAMEKLTALAGKHGLLLVEDAAQGLLASWNGRPLGSFGDYAALSFHSTKNIGCGEGGALLLKADSGREPACQWRDKGTNRQAFLRGEVTHYEWMRAGSAWGLSDINAALLLAQLEQAESLTQARLARWQHYQTLLQAVAQQGLLQLPDPPAAARHNAHIHYVLLRDRATRDRAEAALKQAGIQACSHYEPLHTSPMGRESGRCAGPLAVTESVAGRLLRLPLWSGITAIEQEEVVERLLAILASR